MRLLACALLGALLAGCVVGETRSFSASPERVRAAVKQALAHCPEVNEEGDVIRTGYCPRPLASGTPQSTDLYRESHEVRLLGSSVEVRSLVEERGPHGHGRHRWERRPSEEAQRAVLEAIARILEEGGK